VFVELRQSSSAGWSLHSEKLHPADERDYYHHCW